MWPNSQETADLVTFTKEIRNGKRHFLSSDWNSTNIYLQLHNMLFIYNFL